MSICTWPLMVIPPGLDENYIETLTRQLLMD